MSKFSQIAKGTANVKPVTLPLWGSDVVVGVRPLTGRELGDVLGRAREYAVAHSLKDPKDGDRLYELGQMVHTLALGCVDNESHAVPYFDNAEQILDNLDPDRIVLLYEEQQAWQDECAPRESAIDGADFITTTIKLAGWEAGQPDPLALWRPTLRATYTRTLASQYMDLLTRKSDSGSASGDVASS